MCTLHSSIADRLGKHPTARRERFVGAAYRSDLDACRSLPLETGPATRHMSGSRLLTTKEARSGAMSPELSYANLCPLAIIFDSRPGDSAGHIPHQAGEVRGYGRRGELSAMEYG